MHEASRSSVRNLGKAPDFAKRHDLHFRIARPQLCMRFPRPKWVVEMRKRA